MCWLCFSRFFEVAWARANIKLVISCLGIFFSSTFEKRCIEVFQVTDPDTVSRSGIEWKVLEMTTPVLVE